MRLTIRTALCVMMALVCTAAFAGFKVNTVKGTDTDLTVTVAKAKVVDLDANGEKVYGIDLPESRMSQEKGEPALPVMSAFLMVAGDRDPKVTVVKSEFETLKLDRKLISSKGPLTRNIDPSTVPFTFGASYNEDRWIPADSELVTVEKPFIFRDIRGTRLAVNPVQYNPKRGQLRIYKSFRIRVANDQPASGNVLKGQVKVSKSFESMYQKFFLNFPQVAKRLPRLEENGRLLIICHDEFVDEIGPFIAWKKKCGLEITLAKMSEVGKTADEVKAFIQKEFDRAKMTNIMLVGDAEQIPTLKGVKERADSDPCYTKLAGDDHVPDCIISRLSATTKEQVAYQVAKFINYERFPTVDKPEWYTAGVGIASNEGTPKDWEYMNKNRDALLASLFKSIDQIYDPTATKAKITEAVNAGRSLLNYLGHGSGTSWGTTGYNNSDVGNLANGWMMPVIWDVACVNGRFVNFTGFGESWMRSGNIDKPAGAVVYAGSTTNMEWVPPIWVQVEFNQNYIANQLYKTAGGIFANGIMKGLELYTTDPKKSGVMMFEQWNLFGDSTLMVRFKAPVAIKAEATATKADDQASVKIVVKDAEGKPVANARVVAYTERVENVVVGHTNTDGEAMVTMRGVRDLTGGYVTVIGSDLVPVVDQPLTF